MSILIILNPFLEIMEFWGQIDLVQVRIQLNGVCKHDNGPAGSIKL
jgi:hypothetical protein